MLIYLQNFIILFCLMALTGCAKDPCNRHTADGNSNRQFLGRRVLLLDNVQSCTLLINRPFTVSDTQTQMTLAHFDRLHSREYVTISASGFVIAGKLSSRQITISPEAVCL